MIRPHPPLVLLLVLLAGSFAAWTQAEDVSRVVVVGESRPTGSRLDEAQKRLAAKKWPEAVALLQAVIDSSPSDLVALAPGRSVAARRLAQVALARSGPECLALYRRRIAAQAQRWLEVGEAGDPSGYYRIAEEAFCSRQALVALDRLGDFAFERGRLAEAEAWWRLLAPLEPPDLKGAPLDVLGYPDPPGTLVPRIQAKQLLARLHRGAATWEADLNAFRKRHPGAAGSLAGRKGTYADILTGCARQRELASVSPASHDWPTFGGGPTRGAVVPATDQLPERLSQFCRGGATWRFDLAQRRRVEDVVEEEEDDRKVTAARSLAFYPVVVGHTALVADARHVTAFDLKTGKASEWYDAASFVGGLRPRLTLPAAPDLRYTLTVAEGCVFARMGTQAIRDIRPDARGPRPPLALFNDNGESVLVSLSLEVGPEGHRRRWLVRAVDPGRKEFAIFEGAPVVVAGRVFIAATRFSGDKVITAIHCYPAHPEDSTAPLLWKTDVCETRELLPASSEGPSSKQRARHHLLCVAGPNVVYCSHSGTIVALDGRTGRRAWAVRYPRRDAREPADEPRLRDLSPALFADGRLYVAPNDSDRLFCLDPATGESLWERDGLDAVHLLGVGSGRLIFSTWRNPQQGKLFAGGLRAVDAADGGDGRGWSLPDDGGGLLPFGRGQLVGDLVLWPTARWPYGVFAVRQEDGQQPDNPALLHRIPSGNLLFTGDRLLVTDRQFLWVFGPPERGQDEKEGETRAAPPPSEELSLLVKRGRWREILHRPDLCRLSIEDGRGLPQRAGAIARRELVARKDAENLDRLLRAFWKATPERSRPALLADLASLYPDSPQTSRLLAEAAASAEKQGNLDEAALHWLRLVALATGDEQAAALERLGLVWQRRGYLEGSRTVWRRLVREGAGTIARRAASRLDATPYRDPQPTVSLALPLDTKSAFSLAPGEAILPDLVTEGTTRGYLWSFRNRGLICRRRDDGVLCWSHQLSLLEPWAHLLGSVLLVGDAKGVFAFEAISGARLWSRQAPQRSRYPKPRSPYRVRVAERPAALGQGVLAGTCLVVPEDRRSLLALDALTGDALWQRPAPGAGFEMPFPRGSLASLTRAGSDHLLAQVSGRRWLLDARSGKIQEQAPAELEPWKYRPVPLGNGLAAVPANRETIDILDIPKAKRHVTHKLSAGTLSGGDPPMVVPAGSRLVVVESLNFGLRLVCLDRTTGKEAWPKAVFVEAGSPSEEAWVASEQRLYFAADGFLFAHSLRDGELLWKQALGESGQTRLTLAGPTLIVSPRRTAGWQIQFRSPLGSVQYRGALLAAPPGMATCFDAASGEVVQRIHGEDALFPVQRLVRKEVRSLFPTVRLGPDQQTPDRAIRLDDLGLMIGTGSQVTVLRSRPPPPRK